MIIRPYIIFLFVLVLAGKLSASKTDSLIKEYTRQKDGLNKVYTAGRIISQFENNYDFVKSHAERFLADFKKTNNKYAETYIYYKLGSAAVEYSEYEEAKKNLQKAIVLSKELSNDSLTAVAHIRLGFTFYTIADYEAAIKTYLEGIDYASKAGKPRSISWGYNLLGLATYAKPNHDYKKALYYYFKAIEINNTINESHNSGMLLMRIGSVYTRLEDYSNATFFLDRALKLGDSLNQPVVQKWTLESLTVLYQKKGDYKKAIDVGKESLRFSLKFSEFPGIIISYRNIAENYFQLKDYKKATLAIDSSIYYSLKYGILQTLPNIYETKSSISEKTGLLNEALVYFKRASELKDSIFSVQNSKNINELEARFENNEKEKEIQFLNKEKETDNKIKNVLIIAFILALLSVALVIFILIKINTARKQMKLQKDIIEEKQKEILASIHYAKRIQKSLLPTEKYLERNLNR
ncbi:MAG: SEL1-like repeat protein [Bacteroidetes bacterium]|nr:SEL1-like repeat protein [Bacteroidota bacterium]